MTIGTPQDPISALLIAAAEKLLEKLIESGFDKAKEIYRNLTGARRQELVDAFVQAWEEASGGKYAESLRPLLQHRPFQDAVVTGLLDPVDGYNLDAAREIWQEKFPQYERDLKSFFRNLEKILLRDLPWQALLKPAREMVESAEFQETGKKTGDEINIGELVGQVVLGDQNFLVENGGVLIGDHACVYIYNSYFLPPSGDHKLSQNDFDQLLKDYLLWVERSNTSARLYGSESMAVMRGKPVKSLFDIFLPITLQQFKPLEREDFEYIDREEELPERKRAYLGTVKAKQGQGNEIHLFDLLTLHSRLAIIGGPGCGKSTLLTYLSLSLAHQALTGKKVFDLPRGRKLLVPVLIPLRYYREYKDYCAQSPQYQLEHPYAGTLSGFVPWYINRYSGLNIPDEFFERLLRGGGCLFMLDGLDEVVNLRERGRVRADVEDIIEAQYTGSQIIVTAREAGYKENAVFGDQFVRLDVQPLKNDQIQTLCVNWCKQLYITEVEQRSMELVKMIGEINRRTSERDVMALVSSPLMVTMVISVKFYDTELPRERARLYEAVVRVILQAQYLREDITREELLHQVGEWDEQRDWLSLLALEMHKEGESGAVISEDKLRKILDKVLAADQLERFIQSIRLRGGLFEERAEMFQFIHLTFQEFLAARYLAKQRETSFKLLRDHINDSWWREVFMLMYGFAKIDYAPFSKTYLNWLQKQDGDADQQLGGVELAGAALLDIEKLQSEVSRTVAKQIVKHIQFIQTETSPLIRVRAGITLARLGDPRFDPNMYCLPKEELLGFIHIPAGEFMMGSASEEEEEAGDKEQSRQKVNLLEYYIARYPVTVAQFDKFVRQTSYNQTDEVYKNDPLNHPVRYVSWYDALAYCNWLDQNLRAAPQLPAELRQKFDLGWKISLPCEAQWEKAARGTDGRKYPWGNEFDANRANTEETGIGVTSVVGCFPRGTSPYAVLDLSGNVWEWTRNLWGKNFEKPQYEWPYPLYFPECEDLNAGKDILRIIRGGSFYDNSTWVYCTSRDRCVPDVWYYDLGFRIVFSSS